MRWWKRRELRFTFLLECRQSRLSRDVKMAILPSQSGVMLCAQFRWVFVASDWFSNIVIFCFCRRLTKMLIWLLFWIIWMCSLTCSPSQVCIIIIIINILIVTCFIDISRSALEWMSILYYIKLDQSWMKHQMCLTRLLIYSWDSVPSFKYILYLSYIISYVGGNRIVSDRVRSEAMTYIIWTVQSYSSPRDLFIMLISYRFVLFGQATPFDDEWPNSVIMK